MATNTQRNTGTATQKFNNDFQSRQRLHEQSIGSLFQFPQDLLLKPANSMATVRQLERYVAYSDNSITKPDAPPFGYIHANDVSTDPNQEKTSNTERTSADIAPLSIALVLLAFPASKTLEQ